jgi:hypothetical protein
VLLDPGDHGGRHRFWVRSGGRAFRLDADVFGWVCRPDPAADFPPSRQRPPKDLTAASSVVARPDLIAYTRADSFRVFVRCPLSNPSAV